MKVGDRARRSNHLAQFQHLDLAPPAARRCRAAHTQDTEAELH